MLALVVTWSLIFGSHTWPLVFLMTAKDIEQCYSAYWPVITSCSITDHSHNIQIKRIRYWTFYLGGQPSSFQRWATSVTNGHWRDYTMLVTVYFDGSFVDDDIQILVSFLHVDCRSLSLNETSCLFKKIVSPFEDIFHFDNLNFETNLVKENYFHQTDFGTISSNKFEQKKVVF